jgi:hypothetical protein
MRSSGKEPQNTCLPKAFSKPQRRNQTPSPTWTWLETCEWSSNKLLQVQIQKCFSFRE